MVVEWAGYKWDVRELPPVAAGAISRLGSNDSAARLGACTDIVKAAGVNINDVLLLLFASESEVDILDFVSQILTVGSGRPWKTTVSLCMATVSQWGMVLGFIEEPAASEYFPTMAEVWALIEKGATTLPGERILGMRASGQSLIMTVGVDMASARDIRVEWPQLSELLAEVVNLRDNTRELADNAARYLQNGIENLKNQLISYNGIASAAAKVALDAAEDAKRTAGTAGKSAYQIAVEDGFVGTEKQWLESLQGEPGPEGSPGSAGCVFPAYAGVFPRFAQFARSIGFPRIRGGVPLEVIMSVYMKVFSPHTRGCSAQASVSVCGVSFPCIRGGVIS